MMADETIRTAPRGLRNLLLDAMLGHVPYEGWTDRALKSAAADLAISPEMAELAFPGGALEALDLHLSQADDMLADALAEMDLPSMKIRDRITVAIKTRLTQHGDEREAIRRGMALLMMPPYAIKGSRALWRTADVMWRAAGDTSTDYNWYTKRLTLSGVYASVLLFWLDDESEDFGATWAFLDRRIEDVMTFEKTKARLTGNSGRFPSISRFLGKLRYRS
ncbi:COQ9 family protein [Yunchengibacter salinarum]|uniref:COQ9 family protein n=1 Tax=Yunchengibacter salinarum TaxID=3133399 RepID=UPI0035B6657C